MNLSSIWQCARKLKPPVQSPRNASPRVATYGPYSYWDSAFCESSRANANDRLSRASLGRVEGGDGIVEGRDGADVRPQSSVPHPLDDLAPVGTIGLDNDI